MVHNPRKQGNLLSAKTTYEIRITILREFPSNLLNYQIRKRYSEISKHYQQWRKCLKDDEIDTMPKLPPKALKKFDSEIVSSRVEAFNQIFRFCVETPSILGRKDFQSFLQIPSHVEVQRKVSVAGYLKYHEISAYEILSEILDSDFEVLLKQYQDRKTTDTYLLRDVSQKHTFTCEQFASLMSVLQVSKDKKVAALHLVPRLQNLLKNRETAVKGLQFYSDKQFVEDCIDEILLRKMESKSKHLSTKSFTSLSPESFSPTLSVLIPDYSQKNIPEKDQDSVNSNGVRSRGSIHPPPRPSSLLKDKNHCLLSNLSPTLANERIAYDGELTQLKYVKLFTSLQQAETVEQRTQIIEKYQNYRLNSEQLYFILSCLDDFDERVYTSWIFCQGLLDPENMKKRIDEFSDNLKQYLETLLTFYHFPNIR